MITYRESIKTGNSDGFSTMLRESEDYFKNTQKVSMLGEGFKEIVTDNNLFNQYVNKLVEGLDAEEEKDMRTILENARVEIFNEGSTAGIPPIAALAMPTIRKMWAKVAIKHAIPTMAVKTPAFSVDYSLPYIIDDKRHKHYLPESLKDIDNEMGELIKLSDEFYPISDLNEKDLLADTGRGTSVEAGDSIDRNFSIVEVKMNVTDKNGTNEEEVTVKIRNGKVDIYNKLYAEVKGTHSDGTANFDTIFGMIYPEKGTVTCTTISKKITEIKFKGYVSSESHNHATNASFDIVKKDITIGTGEHYEASMPLEYLNDVKAMYSIDGSAELVDILSNIVALKVDQEAFKFVRSVHENNPKYVGTFDVHPQGRFAGNPKDWLPEIRRVIDYYANKIKGDSYYYTGYFTIIGNTLDTMVIPDVTWSFNHVTEEQNGINVEYNIGAMSSTNRYTIISSDIIPQGSLYMFFVPTTDKFLTLKYFPYTFNVVHNYLNTQNDRIPSIMMTKRHTFEEFLPLICRIDIKNNDGTLVSPVSTAIDGVVNTKAMS